MTYWDRNLSKNGHKCGHLPHCVMPKLETTVCLFCQSWRKLQSSELKSLPFPFCFAVRFSFRVPRSIPKRPSGITNSISRPSGCKITYLPASLQRTLIYDLFEIMNKVYRQRISFSLFFVIFLVLFHGNIGLS